MPSQPYRVHPNFAKILKGTRQSLIDKNDNWLPLPMLAKLRFPIATLEGIEKAVRQQMREHVSPNIALFLWKK
jgi:hypothetical protein